MNFSAIELALVAWGITAVLMALLWLWQWRSQNAGIVDVAWAYLVSACVVFYFLYLPEQESSRNSLIMLLMTIWGVRLGTHLATRVIGQPEDGRYAYMRKSIGRYPNLVFFIFFQLQASWVVLFSLPAWAAMQTGRGACDLFDMLAIVFWLIAMLGEASADRQLKQFRNDPSNKGSVCNVGLWKYSRHPNYFFEWIHWFAYLLFGIGSPYWWINWLALPLILFFLLKLTGIPYTEQQALRTRGEAYARYQRSTSRFIPLPPKQA